MISSFLSLDPFFTKNKTLKNTQAEKRVQLPKTQHEKKKDVKSKVAAKKMVVKIFNIDKFGAKSRWHQIHLNCHY